MSHFISVTFAHIVRVSFALLSITSLKQFALQFCVYFRTKYNENTIDCRSDRVPFKQSARFAAAAAFFPRWLLSRRYPSVVFT